jgi:hypothetical protein
VSQFAPEEARIILVEGWSDAESVGGFADDNARTSVCNDLCDTYGAAALDPYRLIGHVSWSTYEEQGDTYLFVRDGDLFSLSAGYSVYGSYGDTFSEVAAATMEEWLEEVQQCAEHLASNPLY